MKIIIIFIFLFTLLLSSCIQVFSSELSSYEQIKQAWITYKSFFIQQDGRVIDFYGNNISTSEGQSYAMLRSIWMDDKVTFDNVYTWANNNLKVRSDHLYSWKWGENSSGEWTILEKASATDADQDIALALILAYKKWNEPEYLKDALNILNDIWDKEVLKINNNYYLLPGDWASNDESVKINPSYFAPYAYRIFAEYDKKHDWLKLVDSSYELINKSSQLSVFYLPPDWAYLNRKTLAVSVDKDINPKESDFSYDAIRTHLRVALDYILYKDTRALEYLKKSTKFLINYWNINKNMPSSVTINGIIRKGEESSAIYGTVLPAIGVIDDSVSQEIYHKKIAAEYVKGFWGNPKDYYAQNLIWFGVVTWNNINPKNNPITDKGDIDLRSVNNVN